MLQSRQKFSSSPWIIAAILSVIVAAAVHGGSWLKQRDCAATLKTLYFQDDFDRAVEFGDACLGARGSSRAEVAAWLALSEMRAGGPANAKMRAGSLLSLRPNDAVSHLAMAGVHMFAKDRASTALALRHGKSAASLEPGKEEYQWVFASSLRLAGKLSQAEAFLVNNKLTNGSGLLLAELATVRFDRAEARDFRGDELRHALDTTKKAVATNPSNSKAYYVAGDFLMEASKPREALRYLEVAARLSASPTIQAAYWRAIRQSPLPMAEKRRRVLLTVERLRAKDRETGAILNEASRALAAIGDQKSSDRLVDLLLRRYPSSYWASQQSYLRLLPTIAELEQAPPGPNPLRDRTIASLTAILSSESFAKSKLAHDALERLLSLQVLAKSPPSLVESTAHRLARQSADDPRLLAKSGFALASYTNDLKDAEKLARRGLDQMPRYLATYDGRPAEARQLESRQLRAELFHVLGYVHMKQGRWSSAHEELVAAYRLQPDSAKPLHLLGQLEEGRGNFGAAENWYVRCTALFGEEGDDCAGSLRSLYRQRHGTERGLGAYLQRLRPRILSAQRAAVTDTRIPDRKPFNFLRESRAMTDVGRGRLRGKVVVVVFWGSWCDACRVELPRFLEYARKHQADDDIVFVNVNDGKDIQDVRQILRSANNVSTVIDREMFRKAQIFGVPTTMFLDKEGREAFKINGIARALEDEYDYRISALRSEK